MSEIKRKTRFAELIEILGQKKPDLDLQTTDTC